MRIPTLGQYQREASSISKEFDRLGKLQAQVESGKKIQHSSEDPVLGSAIKAAGTYIERLKNYSNNGVMIENHDTFFKSSSNNAVSLIAKIQETMKKVQTGTISNTDRMIYSKSLQENLNQLMGLANTRDSDGQYIYSGNNPTIPPYSLINGKYIYQGGQDPLMVNIKPGTSTLFNDVGNQVFDGISSGNGSFTARAGSSNTGIAFTSPGSVVDNVNYVPDDYTITFVTNNAGELAYQIVGANSGQVLPKPPLVTPTDAPAYQSNTDIIFNGLSININGDAKAGDVFEIQPSTKGNIFDTIQNVINTLQQPVTNVGNYNQVMSQADASLTQAFKHLNTYNVETGARSANNNAKIQNTKDVILQQTTALNALDNADYPEVLSAFYQQSLALQVTQESYIKLQDILTKIIQMHF